MVYLKIDRKESDTVCCEHFTNSMALVCFIVGLVGLSDNSQTFLVIMIAAFSLCLFLMILNAFAQFQSAEFKYLWNVIPADQLEAKLKIIFNNPPKKPISILCYHKRRAGQNRSIRVTTFNQYFYFHYLSWKDVSGTIDLKNAVKDDFCKIKLNLKISFNDAETKQMYHNCYDHVKKSFKDWDRRFKIVEFEALDDFQPFLLVKNKSSFLVSKTMFFLAFFTFTIDIYKWYLRSIIPVEQFDVKKVMSCTANLDERADLKQFSPAIVFGDKIVDCSSPQGNPNCWKGDMPCNQKYTPPEGFNPNLHILQLNNNQQGFNSANPGNAGELNAATPGLAVNEVLNINDDTSQRALNNQNIEYNQVNIQTANMDNAPVGEDIEKGLHINKEGEMLSK